MIVSLFTENTGYDKSSQPVQIVPRKVTKVAQPVLSVAITVRCNILTSDEYALIAT